MRNSSAITQAKRAFLYSFSAGLIICAALMVITVAMHTPGVVTESVSTHIGPLVFFTSQRVADVEGTQASLRAGSGIILLALVFPCLIGADAYRHARTREDSADSAAS